MKFQAHKGINSDTLACAVEHIIIIDVNLASMNKYLCRTEGTLGYFSARSPFLRNITKRVILGLYLFHVKEMLNVFETYYVGESSPTEVLEFALAP